MIKKTYKWWRLSRQLIKVIINTNDQDDNHGRKIDRRVLINEIKEKHNQQRNVMNQSKNQATIEKGNTRTYLKKENNQN